MPNTSLISSIRKSWNSKVVLAIDIKSELAVVVNVVYNIFGSSGLGQLVVAFSAYDSYENVCNDIDIFI